MQIRSEVKAGAVILVAGLLSVVILAAAGRWRSLLTKKQTIRVFFTDVQGVKVSDPVLVMGLELGKVEKMRVIRAKDEAGQSMPAVEVTAVIAYPEALATDTKILASRSLTGSSQLSIEPGRASRTFAAGDTIRGTAPLSVTDLANQAGVMARRLDDFITDLTDRETLAALRGSLMNLKKMTEQANSVMASLNRTIPGTEKGLVSSVKNLEELTSEINRGVAGHKERIAETIKNIQAASQSMARLSDNIDKLVARDKEPLHRAIANAEKATSNIKALTREVRWRPWVLLHKPGGKDLAERAAYNAAVDFSEGAESLNGTVKDLVAALAAAGTKGGPAVGDQEKLKLLAAQVHVNLEKSVELERKLWESLTEKSKGKFP